MPENTEYIEYLVHKFNTGQITPDESRILLEWYNSHDDQQVIILSDHESPQVVKSRILNGLLAKIANDQVHPAKKYAIVKWAVAVAAILIIALGAWIALNYKTPVPDVKLAKTSIEPGGNKATLTLANGQTITLSDKKSGVVINASSFKYNDGEELVSSESPPDRTLAVSTPRGGTYQVILPDGSTVWLNAASSIKFSSSFLASEKRIVELEGEAYFQVKSVYGKDGSKIPFKVISNRQEIEVLGTQFNVNAYLDQESTKTTLVDGKVAIRDEISQFSLTPNQQAITTTEKTRVREVDVYTYTAWRDGKFSFDGKTFEETMKEIGRWYDLDIVYQNGIPSEELIGDAFRNQNINLVLRVMDVAQIDYKLDVARRLLIIKGKK